MLVLQALLLGGLVVAGLVAAADSPTQPAAIPVAQEDRSAQRPPTPREAESEQTRQMIDAEVAVAEGHATAEQSRLVREDARHRADAERRRAWQQHRS